MSWLRLPKFLKRHLHFRDRVLPVVRRELTRPNLGGTRGNDRSHLRTIFSVIVSFNTI